MPPLFRKAEKYIYCWIRKKSSSTKPGGYSTILALACFFLMLQTAGFLSLYYLESAALIQAGMCSSDDLALIKEAKKFAKDQSAAKLCQMPAEKERISEVHGSSLIMQDCSTYIDAVWKDTRFLLYYDQNGITGIEFKKTGPDR